MLDVNITKRLATLDLAVVFSLDAEVLALFGPSGSGKSMTLKMIAGIETPDRGHIRSAEHTFFDSGAGVNLAPQRRRVGYVPQHYALFPHLTALENITFPLRKGLRWPAGRARDRAHELLEMFGLADRAHARPRQLSGGQQQRVSLGRALAGEPDILLLDEPFAALDAPVRAELRQEFRAIQQRLQIPVLFVTHDLEEAASLAGRMAVVIDGAVRQLDLTRTILDRPVDRQVAQLVGARNIVAGAVRRHSTGICADTPIGAIGIAATSLKDGARADIIIRPDAIRIIRPGRPLDQLRDATMVSGTISDLIDHGTRIAVFATVEGTLLEASLSPTAAGRLELRPGDPIQLAILQTYLHVIPADA
ncbi:ABC transporter ATP-binding protein [soil metagenome]